MFQLLQPISLFAIAAIAIPVVIHLWDVRGGKKLRIGSILLIQESARQQGRSLRLTDILLLTLRCLLIILLAFVLAKPIFKKQLTASNEKGWVMMEKQNVLEAYKHFKPTIDSLLKSGFKFHYFNKGFAKAELKDALDSSADIRSQHRDPHWVLLKQLNEQIPSELPVYLFTDNRLKRFAGARPELSMALNWHTYTASDTMATLPAMAYQISTDSIRILSVNNKKTSTSYTSENIPVAGNSKYKLINNTSITVNGNTTLAIDTMEISIIIFTDHFQTDANYVKAAVEAIRQYTQRNINVEIISDASGLKKNIDWLFWLSEKPFPKKLVASNVFLYEKGKAESINSWVSTANKVAMNQEPIILSRRIQASASTVNFETIWRDGFGNSVLSLEKINNRIYHFYSRFNPDWNNLPWSPQFAEMIFDLIVDTDIDATESDKRIIDASQLQPLIAKDKKAFDKEKFVETTDLSKFFWLIAFIIFCAERFLSLRNKNAYA